MTSQTDALGNVTTYSYDSHDLYPETVTNDLGHDLSYTYDYSSGQIATLTDDNADTTTYHYDGLDRLTDVEMSDGGVTVTISEANYDLSGLPNEKHETIHLSATLERDFYT